MTVLTPQPKTQFVSAAGVPLSGGKVYTYAAGTTTPQATYTDSTGATPNPNPVILDSRGEASIWLGSATYKFKLTDANNVEIWTVDYISAPTSGVSPILSGNVTIDSDTAGPALKITQTGTGPVLRVQDSADPDATPFIIDTNGNLGLGTATPTAQMEATGAAKIGSLTLTSAPLPISSGGTSAITAVAARASLGLAIGTDVIGYVAPGTSGNVLVSDGTNWTSALRSVPTIAAGDSGKSLINNGTTASWGSSVILSTAQASTSGTSIDFTGIPSWVRRITVMFSGVSTSGTSNIQIQLGTSSGFTTSGYAGSIANQSGTSTAANTVGFLVSINVAATDVISGQAIIGNITGNTWVSSSTIAFTNTIALRYGAGNIALSGTLDRVRITTAGGTDTFDAGTINIMYE